MVTTTADSGAGSLRQAITDSNNSAGPNTIDFAINSGPQTIVPASLLPAITQAVTIDATTQPGYTNRPLITLNPGSASPLASGLHLNANGCTVRGLAIGNCVAGILVESNGNTIQGNFLGLNADGATAAENMVGIAIEGAANTIGGTTAAARNVISGNGVGLNMVLSAAIHNQIEGNFIGTDATGSTAVPNSEGVALIDGAAANTIGGTSAGAGNVISGNGTDGVDIAGPSVSDNVIDGNLIGTNSSGTTALPNQGDGVHMDGANGNTIGGTTQGSGNLISGNQGAGLVLEAGALLFISGNIVQGNKIGTNASGTAALPNQGDGVHMTAANSNIIGGTTPGASNLISGNQGTGVVFQGGDDNVLQGNLIGTDTTGTTTLANQGGGVVLVQCRGNTLGGTASGAGNVISGNAQFGILIRDGAVANGVQGNLVGTNAANTPGLGNGLYGVAVVDATGNIIGGTVAGAGNVIGNSTAFGLLLSNGANDTLVQGNDIGLGTSGVALPNGLDGVAVVASANNTLGGTAAGAGNVISGNDRFGVFLNGTGTSGNVVQGNLIGTNAAGTGAVPNTFDGVAVLNGASGNTIGGTVPAAGNILSGNGRFGVYLNGTGTSFNLVQGNLIGLNRAGTASLGNTFDGVAVLSGAGTNNIGGLVGGAGGNIIAGNGRFGVLLGANNTVVQDNVIGTNLAGSAGLGNALDGIGVVDAANNIIGSTTTNAGNLISGNDRFGVFLTGPNATGNVLQNNAIGTNAAGTAALGNAVDGVALVNGANGNTIGGTTPGTGNLLSGNDRFGVYLLDSGTSGNVVAGNLIGVNRSGTAALGNTFDGVVLSSGAAGNTVGGTGSGAGNTIAGNGRFGILLGVSGTTNNLVQGNFIGTDASGALVLGNGNAGVAEGNGAASNTVGGTGTGAGNIIANNGGPGVIVGFAASDTGTVGDAVLGNAIHSNGPAQTGLGIDLGDNGATANGSGPNGPNHFQNFPVFTGAPTLANNAATATLTFSSLFNSTFRLEFFLNNVTDTPQGRTFLGAVSVTTDANGSVLSVTPLTPGVTASVNATSHVVTVTLPLPSGTVAGALTATGTVLTVGTGQPGSVGDTSEFSSPAVFGVA
jgi:hypothetical protein